MPRLSTREFKEIVRQVMTTLPLEIAAHTGNVVVDVASEPTDDQLRGAGYTDEEIEEGYSVLGLCEPMELPTAEGIDTADRPCRLWIFKAPHEEEYPDPKQLRTEIRKTVIHELAHHFGFDEDDLEKWDANPDPFRDEM